MAPNKAHEFAPRHKTGENSHEFFYQSEQMHINFA